MEAKKTISANLETQRSTFLLLGFVFVFGLFYVAFEWSKQLNIDNTIENITASFIDDGETPITDQNKKIDPIAPPPKKIVTDIKIVDNTKATTTATLFDPEDNGTVTTQAIQKPIVTEVDEVLPFSEKKPSYPGGKEALDEFIAGNTVFPADLRDLGIEGRITCKFTVNKDGSISDISVISKNGEPAFEEEAKRVIASMPTWIPGENNYKKVRVSVVLPFKFELPKE